jgi:hypothetical protein
MKGEFDMASTCKKCGGTGKCANCHGTGKVEGTGFGTVDKTKPDCAFCGGERLCRICRGTGTLR